MKKNNPSVRLYLKLPALLLLSCLNTFSQNVSHVKIKDAFWSPKLQQWSTTTVNDVLNKFEGLNKSTPAEQQNNNAFTNFDDVAAGKTNTGHHVGFPWFDGLVYETIRGTADFLSYMPNKAVEQRIDSIIDRIYAAQQANKNGYINTYTELVEPTHQWGFNGGFLRWQHDVYNAGMLVEAGVHYYRATGKIKLLQVATRFANYMCSIMGPAPKRNIVPAHSGPEEAMMKLYWLYKNNPSLKKKIGIPVSEQSYYQLAKFWIENRGNNCGYPLWATWGNEQSEKWIKENNYVNPEFGENSRPAWGDYAQDSISVFKQQTIEGHAVRATLLATGITAVALENRSPQYIQTATRLWDNMVGQRMFITGGVGAIHNDEKFGADYFLPTDAYLETCAAVGAGFFSKRMNELTGDAKYMDEFERTLYNNVLTGISLSGNRYTYQNPLNAHKYARWEWHECPCCPPMFLKIMSALPTYIYACEADKVNVNLYIGSEATVKLNGGNAVKLQQQTDYPWSGQIQLTVDPQKTTAFTLRLRIPGWAQGRENPYGLYQNNLHASIMLNVNGQTQQLSVVNGYTEIKRTWKKGDKVTLVLPVQPRVITANNQAKDLRQMISLASGPIIYCLEEVDNKDLDNLAIDTKLPLTLSFENSTLNGVNIIKGTAINNNTQKITFTAIPYFAVGNRQQEVGYKVWVEGK